MTLTDHHRLLIEAACDEVLAAGRALRDPWPSIGPGPATLNRYTTAVDYLRTLLNKLDRANANAH